MTRYDGPANYVDQPVAIAVDAQGNVYVTGSSCARTDGIICLDYDYATIKYDPDGNELWVARYDGPGHGHDLAAGLALDAEGHVYVTGSSCRTGFTFPRCLDYVTIKYDTDGNELWLARETRADNLTGDHAVGLALDAVGNLYVSGYIRPGFGDISYATIKYDPDGTRRWVVRYVDGANAEAAAIAADPGGNVYVTGESFGSDRGYATVKYDTEGHQLWVARRTGAMPTALALDGEGSVYVTG